jgi:CSLREA domain-containing protein
MACKRKNVSIIFMSINNYISPLICWKLNCIKKTSYHSFVKNSFSLILFISLVFVAEIEFLRAENFIVTKVADTNDGICDSDCSLREAINSANNSPTDDLINFQEITFSSQKTIFLSFGELNISSNGNLLINGNPTHRVSIDANNQSRIFSINQANLIVRHLNLQNGNGQGLTFQDLGGAVLILKASAVFENVNIKNNRTLRNGGAFFINEGTLNLVHCNIENNIANGDGGAILNGLRSSLDINFSTISSNSGSSGGGIFNFGKLSISNSTISQNRANSIGYGGGILNEGLFSASTIITNSTICNNFANNKGGGIVSLSPLLEFVIIKNTIVADNNAFISSPDLDGMITSSVNNLIENTSGLDITHENFNNIFGRDPQLLPLRSYGGLTPTHALRKSSPAIDKGSLISGITADQRNLTRPFDSPIFTNAPDGNGSDIGAFERQNFETFLEIPFDFDGDSKTDISIYRPTLGQWWYSRSSDNGTRAFQFGTTTDKIVPADYTGDGKTDIATFTPSTGFWNILRSEDSTFYGFPFGTSGDIAAPADYDGDGKADAAIFRSSSATWFISRSGGGTTISQFGAIGDKPTVADYDGDGKADLAIYRVALGQWWYCEVLTEQIVRSNSARQPTNQSKAITRATEKQTSHSSVQQAANGSFCGVKIQRFLASRLVQMEIFLHPVITMAMADTMQLFSDQVRQLGF